MEHEKKSRMIQKMIGGSQNTPAVRQMPKKICEESAYKKQSKWKAYNFFGKSELSSEVLSSLSKRQET